jgi:drug/metabolite transporter (DMT)-like permease
MSTDTADLPPPARPRIDIRRGTVWMLLSLVCFSSNSLMLKYFASTRHIDPWVSMTFRFGIGLVMTWIMFAPGGTLNLGRSFRSSLLASRGVMGGLGTAAYYTSVGPLGAGKATLIGNTWCVFAAIMAMVVLGEKLSLMKALGIAITLSGLAMLTGLAPGTIGVFGHWEMVSLTGAILAAAVVVVIRQLTATETSATIFASQCIYGLLLALPFAVHQAPHLGAVDIALLCFAALCAGVGQLAMTEGFRFLTVAAGGAFQITLPVVISLASIGLFNEHFTWAQAFGAMLILGGSFQTVRK